MRVNGALELLGTRVELKSDVMRQDTVVAALSHCNANNFRVLLIVDSREMGKTVCDEIMRYLSDDENPTVRVGFCVL